MGFVMQRLSDLSGARETFNAEYDILRRLVEQQPANMLWKRSLATNYGYRSQLQEFFGDVDGALDLQRMQLQLSEEVSRRDPANAQQIREVAISHVRGGRLLRLRRSFDESLSNLDAASAMLHELIGKTPQQKQWHRDLARVEINRALTLLALRRIADVTVSLSAADNELQNSGENQEVRRSRAESMVVKGDAEAARGDAVQARLLWSNAVNAMRRTPDTDPLTDALYAGALLRLGRADDATAVLARLDRIGYRQPDLASLRSSK